MEIKKKVWPESFEEIKSGKKSVELRLADFNIKAGDSLVLEEYNPETKKYTGRSIRKIVSGVEKSDILQFYDAEQVKTHGLLIIQLR